MMRETVGNIARIIDGGEERGVGFLKLSARLPTRMPEEQEIRRGIKLAFGCPFKVVYNAS
jgi:hypothetical protein